MSGFQITITDAGRAALIDAQNTGTVAFRLSQIGVSTQHVGGALPALPSLPNERKRLATMAGDVVADDTLHVTIRDETADAYALRAFGLYTSTGVLFAVYSQPDPILEKSDAAMLLLAIDAKLVALGTAQIEFGPADFSMPPASESLAGVVEIATDAEVDAGVDPWRVITARTLKRALGALSGFALKVHQHDAADTTTGVFHVGRIPALDMSKITGLAGALAAKAADVHTHTINQVVGLVDALAGKAASVHQHVADDIVSGVLAVGRIPALGMEKITGLALALAAKAGLDSPDFTGITRLPSQTLFKKEAPGTAEGGQFQLERPDQSTLGGDIIVDVNGGNVRFYEKAAPFRGFTLPIAEMAGGVGSYPWLNSNFNPDAKANLNTPSFTGVSWFGTDRPGKLNLQGADDRAGIIEFHGPAGRVGFIGYGDGPGGNPYIGSDPGKVWIFNQRPVFGSFVPWDSGNFNPDAKATLGQNARFADIFASRNAVDGALYFGTEAARWLGYIGGYGFDLHGQGGLFVNGHQAWTAGNLLPASAAETVAGVESGRFVTPAALWSFARSIGANGYQQVPGTDLVIQWGVSPSSHPEGAVHAALPIAFGGGCLFACAMPRNGAANITSDYYMQVVGRYQDRIVFFANRANGGAGNVPGYEWMAIGLARGNPDPIFDSGGGGIPPGGGGQVEL